MIVIELQILTIYYRQGDTLNTMSFFFYMYTFLMYNYSYDILYYYASSVLLTLIERVSVTNNRLN